MLRKLSKDELTKSSLLLLGFLVCLYFLHLVNIRLVKSITYITIAKSSRFHYHYLSVFLISISFTFLFLFLNRLGSYFLSKNRLPFFVGIITALFMAIIDRYAILPLLENNHLTHGFDRVKNISLDFQFTVMFLYFSVSFYASIYYTKYTNFMIKMYDVRTIYFENPHKVWNNS